MKRVSEALRLPCLLTVEEEATPMRSITRSRPKTDRIACPWLLRRFIDPDADIVFVSPDEVIRTAASDPAANSFDAPGADYTHRDNLCTFEVLIDEVWPRRRPHASTAGEDR